METVQQQFIAIKRGTSEIISKEDIIKKLNGGRKLNIKFGADPSAPDIHLGHTVILRKLRLFQELGHKVIFLIGDFTGLIGDPTGRDKTRRPLSRQEIQANAETYKQQIGKILDLSKLEVVFNSSWLSVLKMEDILKMASFFTMARMLEHNTFKKRFEANDPIRINEFFYPFLQAYDSVILKADVELGGTDQTFNMTFARDLQKFYEQEPQVALTMPILLGLDGRQKMSKSLGNYVGINETAQSMYHKIYNIPDNLLWSYFELLTDISVEEVTELRNKMYKGEEDPRLIKEKLAVEIVTQYHGMEKAFYARQEEKKVHVGEAVPEGTPEYHCGKDEIGIIDLVLNAGFCRTKGEARRLVQGGGIYVDKKKAADINEVVAIGKGVLLQAGKRKFVKVLV